MTDITDLITRLENATGPDREIDIEIGLQIAGWKRVEVLPPQSMMMLSIDGDLFPDHPGAMFPSFTESVDTALALVEKVLPDFKGWFGSEHRFKNSPTRFECGIVVHWGKVGARTAGRYTGECANMPIAICIALLKAKQEIDNGTE